MERDAFHVPYLSDKTPEAVFHGQAVKTVAYLRVLTAHLRVSKTAIAKLTGVSRTTLYSFMRTRGAQAEPLECNLVGTLGPFREVTPRIAAIWTNPELTHTYARLRSERRSAGWEMPMADAWIAATAIMLECPLASHDHGFADIPELELVQAP